MTQTPAEGPALHPFDPKSKPSEWPSICDPKTWPEYPPAPVGAHKIEATRSAVYRFYDKDRRSLYVGVTTNPFHRWIPHRHNEWWPMIRFLALEPVNPATRLAAEQEAIRTDNPQFNVTRNAVKGTAISFEKGMADVVAQFKRRLSDKNFAELVRAFKAEPDAPTDHSPTY